MQAPANSAAPQLDAIKKNISGHLTRMLMFRRPYDPVRFKWFRQYINSRDQKLFPDGITKRSNTVVPYAYSNVETVVSRTSDAFFSINPWFECDGRGEMDEPAAEAMQPVLEAKLHLAKLPQHFENLTRTIGMYGHGAIKVDWDWGYDTVTYPAVVPVMGPAVDQNGLPMSDEQGQPMQAPIQHPITGQPITRVVMQTKQVPRNRPKFYVIDPYDLLVDPDGSMVAVCIERTLGDLKKEAAMYEAQTQKQLYDPQALTDLVQRVTASNPDDADNTLIRMAEYWNADGSMAVMTFGEDRDAVGWKDQRYAVRSGSSYSPYKRKMYVGENILLYYGDSPFAHKQIPILHTSYSKLPHEVYGIGVVEVSHDLNEALNSMVNMIRDNWNIGANHRFLFDTTMDIDHESLSQANVPGGKVGVSGNPQEAIFPLPNFTPNNGDYQLLELFKSQIELSTGISDFYSKGVGGPGPNSTATGISSIINESNFRFKLFIRNLELDILQPLLEMSASNIQQFLTDPEEILITDAPPQIPKYLQVQPEKLIGALQFKLVAANYATNEVVRQRNMMALAGLMAQNPYIDQFEATKTLLKTFKIPDYAQMLKSPQQVAMEQQQQMMQQVQMMMLEHQMEMEKIQAGAVARVDAAKGKTPPSLKGGKGAGRPPGLMQPEGPMPGVGNTGPTREVAQMQGLNGMGLGGIQES